MIINIPLQIDDAAIEGKLTKDFERIVAEKVCREIEEALKNKVKYSYKDSPTDGMTEIVYSIVENKIKHDWKDEIVKVAGKELAKKTSKTKAAKELKEKKK